MYSNNVQYNQTNPVNFTGYRTLLGKKLDEVIKLDRISAEDNEFILNELKNLLLKRLSRHKNLGEGTQNRVYKIDDKYVIRVPINRGILLDNQVILKKQKFQDLKTYYGEPVAEVGNIQILKNASPNGTAIPAGIPKDLPDSFEKYDITGYYSNLYLPTFAEIPQRSYDALARDMKTLNAFKDEQCVSFTFDYYNPNNIILSGKTLKMTDAIEPTIIRNSNSLSDMLNVFLKQINVGIPATPSIKLMPLRQKIARKILKAAVKNDLPITSEGRPNNVFSFVIKFLCGSKDEPCKVFETLNSIKQSAKTPEQKQKILDKYLNTIFQA